MCCTKLAASPKHIFAELQGMSPQMNFINGGRTMLTAKENMRQVILGGNPDRNLLSSAGDMGLISGLGRSHMSWDN